MSRRIKLSPHKHSGRVLRHHHTSYAALAFVALLAGLVLMTITQSSRAYSLTESADVSATIPIQPPAKAPIILVPTDSQRFSAIPIDVAGKCTANMVVNLYRNSVFAGSTRCTPSGTFSLKADLAFGRNELLARQFNQLNMQSPDSNLVVVFYDQTGERSQQLSLKADKPYRVGYLEAVFSWQFELTGGKKPYAVVWDWGDGTSEVISLSEPGTREVKHQYKKPGDFTITVRATDKDGNEAYLQLLAVVYGPFGPATTKPTFPFDGGLVAILWPLYLLMVSMIISFWLGERYELYKVKQKFAEHTPLFQPNIQ